jgi:hypothetical protein
MRPFYKPTVKKTISLEKPVFGNDSDFPATPKPKATGSQSVAFGLVERM